MGIFAPATPMVVALGVLAVGGLAFDLLRLRVPRLNRPLVRLLAPLLKGGEEHRITGATYLAIAAFVSFLLFDRQVAVAALLFVSLGDPAAAVVGGRMVGPRVWGKSPGGTLAFVAVALVVAAVLVATGVVERHWGLLVGAAVAGLVELAPMLWPISKEGSRAALDDNLTVPLVSGAAMQFLGV